MSSPILEQRGKGRLWQSLLVFAGLGLGDGVATLLTGGFVLRTSLLTVRANDPLRPLVAGVLAAGLYVACRRKAWTRDVAEIARWRWPPVIAAACILAAFFYAIEHGTLFGAGPDQSGYVSQADGWARAQLTWTAPTWAQQGLWHNAVWSSAPVGYRPATDGRIAPVYSPGYPLVMALFEVIGGRDAVFDVVPLLGAAVIGATYLLGVALSGEWAGAIAAVLMLASPVFIDWLSQPMSDIPVTACWTVALLFALRLRTADAIGAGIATALAILIRPNTAPLAIVPALLLMTERPHRVRRAALFLIPLVPSAALIAVLNARWWGSPLLSGYGDNDTLYSMTHIAPNLRRYLAWIMDTQSPLMFAGLLAPLVAHDSRHRLRLLLITVVFPLLVLALYLPYLEFDGWPFLRFLLPAFPVVLVGLGTLMAELTRRSWDSRTALAVIATVSLAVVAMEWRTDVTSGVTGEKASHEVFASAVEFAKTLPQNAILVSDSYSGTLHFYTGRDVLRYNTIWPEDMDGVLDALRAQGHPLYFIGHGFDVDGFKRLFRGSRAAAALDEHRVLNDEGYAVADLSASK